MSTKVRTKIEVFDKSQRLRLESTINGQSFDLMKGKRERGS